MSDIQPNLQQLVEELQPIRKKWKLFGLFLGISNDDLEVIDVDKRNVEDKLYALCYKWLQMKPRGTWKDVVKTMKKMKRLDLAERFEDKHIKHHMSYDKFTPSHTTDYRKALSQGQLAVAYSRIMLIGSAGVGKSSLKRGLMNLPFDARINSTIVADVPSLRPVGLEWAMAGEECNRGWRGVTPEDEIEELAQLISIVYKQPEDRGTSSAIKAASALFSQVTSITSDASQEYNSSEIEQMVEEILSPAMNRARQMRHYDIEHIKPLPFFHVWDCGSQPVFLEVLPAFLTSRTMFLLLFDASTNLNTTLKAIRYQQGRKIEEGEVNMTTLELMEGWMANIHGHLAKYDDKGGLVEYPRIVAVGTRGDKLTDAEKSEVKANLLRCLKDTSESQKDKTFLQLLQDIVIVDNTTSGKGEEEDEAYKYLRKEIYDFTSEKLVVRTPIKWVLFRKVLQSLTEKSVNTITLREACAIGVACKITPEDVPSALKFYHELGVILFYSRVKGLQEKVILNPKWFVECLGKVLTLQGREEFEQRDMWKLLREKGILVQPLYVAVWKECEGMDPEEMVQLLVSFGLAAEFQTDEFGERLSKQFFVPAVFPIGDPLSALPPGYQHRATPLHITFGTGYVIPGFFTRLVTTMAGKPECQLYFRDGIFRNRVTLEFGDINRITLTELSNAIQVELLRYIPDAPTLTPIKKSCQDLQVLLETCSQGVQESLQSSNVSIYTDVKEMAVSNVTREVKFLCQGLECNSSSDPHYLRPLHGQTCEIDIQCERSRVYRKLTRNEAYWFPRIIEATSVSILKKSPEPLDVYHLLNKKSAKWNHVRIELGLDANFGDSLLQNPGLDGNDRLDRVLTKWIEAQPSPVTWAKILEILKSLKWIDIVKEVNDYLQRPDVIMKYSEKEDFRVTLSPEVEAALKEAMKQGAGNANLILILMHGAPLAGKTSVKLVIQNDPPQSKGESTGTIENPVRLISTARFATDKTNAGEDVLFKVDEKKLIEMIATRVNSLKQQSSDISHAKDDSHQTNIIATLTPSVNPEVQMSDPAISEYTPSQSETIEMTGDITDVQTPDILNDDSDEKKSIEMIATRVNCLKQQSEVQISNPASSEYTPSQSETIEMTGVITEVVQTVDILKNDSADLFDAQMIHLIDSGGQPQFTDVVPLMFHGASLHIIVIRLDEKLIDKPKVEFLVDGENQYNYPENVSLTTLQMIERTCELANSNPENPQSVMIVGTRYDKKCEESLEEKNEQLEEIFQKYKHNIIRAGDGGIIFAMNAVTTDPEKRAEYTRILQNQILHAEKIGKDFKVPVRWMIFDLEVQRRATKEGILQMSICSEVAQLCHLDENEMKNALQYFTEVALHMYYPKVDRDLLFTNITPVVQRLTNVLSASFLSPEYGPQAKDRQQLRGGELTKALLDKLWQQKFDQSIFTAETFLKLLEYLYIAVKKNKETYFLPCVLPLDDPTNEVLKSFVNGEVDPILLMRDENILPQGFFPAVVVGLIKTSKFKLVPLNSEMPRLRRAIALEISSDTCSICLVDQISWIDVYLSGDTNDCPAVLKAVEKSAESTSKLLKIKKVVLKRGFYCPGDCRVEVRHPCILTEDGGAKCSRCESHRFPKRRLKSVDIWLNRTSQLDTKEDIEEAVKGIWDDLKRKEEDVSRLPTESTDEGTGEDIQRNATKPDETVRRRYPIASSERPNANANAKSKPGVSVPLYIFIFLIIFIIFICVDLRGLCYFSTVINKLFSDFN